MSFLCQLMFHLENLSVHHWLILPWLILLCIFATKNPFLPLVFFLALLPSSLDKSFSARAILQFPSSYEVTNDFTGDRLCDFTSTGDLILILGDLISIGLIEMLLVVPGVLGDLSMDEGECGEQWGVCRGVKYRLLEAIEGWEEVTLNPSVEVSIWKSGDNIIVVWRSGYMIVIKTMYQQTLLL